MKNIQGGNFVKTVLPPFWKGVYSKMNEYAPEKGANPFFLV